MREIKFRAWMIGSERMLHNVTVEPPESIAHSVVEYMQYTGLKDKNGVEIYEGDIVKHKLLTVKSELKEVKAPIEWYRGCFVTNDGAVADLYSQNTNRDFEVIGNIYETPELLK